MVQLLLSTYNFSETTNLKFRVKCYRLSSKRLIPTKNVSKRRLMKEKENLKVE